MSTLNDHSKIIWLLSLAAALIFFQAYMIAPLIPKLSEVFGVPEQQIGLVVPAYMIAYGISILFYGMISDRVGRGKIIKISLFAFMLLTAFTALAQSSSQLIVLRLLTGLGASGVVPMSLALVGDLYEPNERGKPLGLLFAAMEGGMALGSTAGVMLEPFIGWRMLFLGMAILAAIILWLQGDKISRPYQKQETYKPTAGQLLSGFYKLLSTARGLKTYCFVFWNGIFHSGIFTWLGLYFVQKYDLGAIGIGLAILGYGLPGFFFGSLIGRAADRYGRFRIIIPGLGIAALATALLATNISVIMAAVAVTVISLGYDLTQPLFAGIVTEIGGKKQGGQAMGLNVFALFTGFGVGSLVFGEILGFGLDNALLVFAAIQFFVTIIAVPLLKNEKK
ncbi:MFS transporter [Cyclobacterium marinum]|uniref:MFS transporter n=1 Tax=Cyclobacterium marinum TaxID=104 RepID=UPI0011EFE649|nr:MFS transporter [Cyclobacterium marinum]MBI0398065.1 MFS transporter [Cyclobacterium marinum]